MGMLSRPASARRLSERRVNRRVAGEQQLAFLVFDVHAGAAVEQVFWFECFGEALFQRVVDGAKGAAQVDPFGLVELPQDDLGGVLREGAVFSAAALAWAFGWKVEEAERFERRGLLLEDRSVLQERELVDVVLQLGVAKGA